MYMYCTITCHNPSLNFLLHEDHERLPPLGNLPLINLIDFMQIGFPSSCEQLICQIVPPVTNGSLSIQLLSGPAYLPDLILCFLSVSLVSLL